MAFGNKQAGKSSGIQYSKRLSIKLVIETLVFSLLISVLVSAIQIYSNYQSSMKAAEGRYTEIETGFLPSLSAGLWEVNTQRVDALLDSIAQLPNVGRIYLIDEENNTLTRNSISNRTFSKREMNLIYTQNGTSFDVGRLIVELNNEALWGQLKKQALETATITSLTLFSTSLFILFLFQQRVSRHLQTMAKFAKEFDVHHLGTPLTLQRKKNSQADELDIVVNAINEMQSALQHELALRTQVEKTLRSHHENLEGLVKERTLALKLSADQLAIAADVAALGVWQWNIHDDSLEWNAQMFNIFALPKSLREEGLNFQHWYNRVHPDDAAETAASLQAELQGTGKMKTEYRILLPNGQVRYLQAALKIERDASGQATRAIGIILDITPRMEIENNLRKAKEQADAANAAKSSFLANMSHEIRTPMNAVLGMLQLLQKTKLSPQQSDYIIKSQNAAKSLLNLLNDILDLSKAEAGKLQLEKNPFDLESLLQDLAVSVSASQTNDAVELMFDIDPRIPRSLIGDKFRLQQILINLAGNALKFTPKGHVSIVLEQVQCSVKEVQIKFSVIDTGIGISDEHIEHIFDEFIQAEASTTRRFGGTGLGLVISKQLVQGMGGELKASSKLGVGSHFWFKVSLELGDAKFVPTLKISDAIKKLRVLVVDDNASSRHILVRTLSKHTRAVDEASSERQAIDIIRQAERDKQDYDIVLIDWRTTKLSNHSIAEAIARDPSISKKTISILLASYANAALMSAQDEPSSLYAEVLFKPLTPLQLIQSISHLLQNKQLREPLKPLISKKSLAGLRVLVVDDNEINREIAYELLKNEGAEVKLADCGVKGVETVTSAEHEFDIVLMDIQMPDIDGYEATRQIRADQRFASLSILALTANVAQTDIDNCLAAGMNGHIGKPFNMSQVVESILKSQKNKAIEKNLQH